MKENNNFGSSLDNLIEKLRKPKEMKNNIINYINNVSEKLVECQRYAEVELDNVKNTRKIIYNINNSRNFLKEDSPSYIWRNSPSMLYLFQTREKFELVKNTIEKSIFLENKFLNLLNIKSNYIKVAKIIIENFYNNIKNEKGVNEKELKIAENFSNSIENLNIKLKEIKEKKESLIELEKTFYEKVYGQVKV